MLRYFRKHQGPKQETFLRKRRKSSLSSHNRDNRLKFETLEPRWLLDGTMLQISEFMADNTKTPADAATDRISSRAARNRSPNASTVVVRDAGWSSGSPRGSIASAGFSSVGKRNR